MIERLRNLLSKRFFRSRVKSFFSLAAYKEWPYYSRNSRKTQYHNGFNQLFYINLGICERPGTVALTGIIDKMCLYDDPFSNDQIKALSEAKI